MRRQPLTGLTDGQLAELTLRVVAQLRAPMAEPGGRPAAFGLSEEGGRHRAPVDKFDETLNAIIGLVNLARFAEGEPALEQGSWNMPSSCCPTSRSAAAPWVR